MTTDFITLMNLAEKQASSFKTLQTCIIALAEGYVGLLRTLEEKGMLDKPEVRNLLDTVGRKLDD